MTLHRPSNVDDPAILAGIVGALAEIARELPIVFPIHPRTRKMAEQFGLSHHFSSGLPVRGIWVTEPLGYLEFLHLNMHARLVLTDSGGLQEETTVLGVPCITMRHNTERPITCEVGTNVLVGNDPTAILAAARPDSRRRNRQRPGAGVVGWPRGGTNCRGFVKSFVNAGATRRVALGEASPLTKNRIKELMSVHDRPTID